MSFTRNLSIYLSVYLSYRGASERKTTGVAAAARAMLLAVAGGVRALLPLDDESYMLQTRAERARKLRAARQNEVGSQFPS